MVTENKIFTNHKVLKKNINDELKKLIIDRILGEFSPLEISQILEEDYKNIHSQFTRGVATMKLKTLFKYAEGLDIQISVAVS